MHRSIRNSTHFLDATKKAKQEKIDLRIPLVGHAIIYVQPDPFKYQKSSTFDQSHILVKARNLGCQNNK